MFEVIYYSLASTGNYALAVAEAMAIRKRRATIYVAEDLEP